MVTAANLLIARERAAAAGPASAVKTVTMPCSGKAPIGTLCAESGGARTAPDPTDKSSTRHRRPARVRVRPGPRRRPQILTARVVPPVVGADPVGAHQRAVAQSEVAMCPGQLPQRRGQAATQRGSTATAFQTSR